jgi:hypothetical protein
MNIWEFIGNVFLLISLILIIHSFSMQIRNLRERIDKLEGR